MKEQHTESKKNEDNQTDGHLGGWLPTLIFCVTVFWGLILFGFWMGQMHTKKLIRDTIDAGGFAFEETTYTIEERNNNGTITSRD